MEASALQKQIQELMYASIRAFDLKENDGVSLKTLKLILVGQVLEAVGLDWSYLINLFKTHTPVHPEIAKELKSLVGDEDASSTLAQIFVRNERLVRLLKAHGKEKEKEREIERKVNSILAIDGLGGNVDNGPNFEQRHYVGHLRYGNKGDTKMFFDNDPECKRVHVQTVRELYRKLEKVPAPEKQIYEMVRHSFLEVAKVALPEVDIMEEEVMDKKIQAECYRYYMKAMGKENVEQLVKTLKRTKGEKRTSGEREDEPAGPSEKR